MTRLPNATVERIDGRKAPTGDSAAMYTVRDVARQLQCSTRHIHRLVDAGRMPRPIRLGSLVRWRRADIENWIDQNRPNMRKERS